MACRFSNDFRDWYKYFRCYRIYNYDEIMSEAAYRGNIELVKIMLNLGATKYNSAMINAAYTGHIDIVRLMIDRGATKFEKAIGYAAIGGHQNIIDYLTNVKFSS